MLALKNWLIAIILLTSFATVTVQVGIITTKSSVRQQSMTSFTAPLLVDARPYFFQYWNRQLSRIAQSIFKLYIYPNDGTNVYTATAFLCSIELQGALRSGTFYGFITVNHGIDLNLIVPTTGVKLEAVFDEKTDRFWLEMHVDTGSWFTDKFLDVTFFELRQALVKKMLRKNHDFLPITASTTNRGVDLDTGRELVMFGVASAYLEPTFISGWVIDNLGVPGNIYYNIESLPGTSGAPLFDRRTYEVVGVHKAYDEEGNYRVGVACWAIVSKMEELGLQPPATKNESDGWILAVTVKKLAPFFHEAVQSGNLNKAKEIVDELRSKLSLSTSSNDVAEIKPLIENRRQGMTPLMEAVKDNHLAIAKFLIRDCGADVFYRGIPNGGFSPFLNASYTGNFDVVKLMLDLRPDLLETRNFYNNTALNFAAVGGHVKIVQLLVDNYKANVDNQGYLGRSPLYMAATSFMVEPIKFLAARGANVRLTSENGETAIHFAASNNNREIVDILLNADPDLLSIFDSNNETVLHRAAYLQDISLIEYLVSNKKADQTVQNGQGKTPFLIAASNHNGTLSALAYLLSHGSAISAVDNFGNNALHFAAQRNDFILAQFLLMHEPTLASVKNSDGNIPLMVAKKAGAKGVFDLLSSTREYYNI